MVSKGASWDKKRARANQSLSEDVLAIGGNLHRLDHYFCYGCAQSALTAVAKPCQFLLHTQIGMAWAGMEILQDCFRYPENSVAACSQIEDTHAKQRPRNDGVNALTAILDKAQTHHKIMRGHRKATRGHHIYLKRREATTYLETANFGTLDGCPRTLRLFL